MGVYKKHKERRLRGSSVRVRNERRSGGWGEKERGTPCQPDASDRHGNPGTALDRPPREKKLCQEKYFERSR
jgi:hypothetical protein